MLQLSQLRRLLCISAFLFRRHWEISSVVKSAADPEKRPKLCPEVSDEGECWWVISAGADFYLHSMQAFFLITSENV